MRKSAERASILSVLVTNDTDSPTYKLSLTGEGIMIDTQVNKAVAGAVARLVFEGVAAVAPSVQREDDPPPPPKKRRASRVRGTPAGGEGGAKPKNAVGRAGLGLSGT